MMSHRCAGVLAIAALLVSAVPVLAHHSLQSEFDINKSITLKGTVTKVEWVNPHVYVYLDVKDSNGTVTNWALESLPTAVLRRGGLTKQMLGLGETVEILGYGSHDGSNLAFLRKITFGDGHTVEIWLGDLTKASTVQ
jgi:hypothetical protein